MSSNSRGLLRAILGPSSHGVSRTSTSSFDLSDPQCEGGPSITTDSDASFDLGTRRIIKEGKYFFVTDHDRIALRGKDHILLTQHSQIHSQGNIVIGKGNTVEGGGNEMYESLDIAAEFNTRIKRLAHALTRFGQVSTKNDTEANRVRILLHLL